MKMASGPSAKDQIKQAADIVDLIGQFIRLRKAGRNYVGLCPFHAEKAPSFTVSPERQTFHCFGCKKGGDIFSFWMEYHNTTFPEALKELADRYHITITERASDPGQRKRAEVKEALFHVNEQAALYFQKALKHPAKGKQGRAYFEGRAISDGIIDEFRLGYAPDEWDGLIGYLRRQRMDLSLAARAGLIIPKKSGGFYDRFRGRVMFPIFDMRSHLIGFGGRVLDESLPKYLNTPETPIFRKGEFPYGLHASFKAIRERGRAVVVEGYMDYLALRNHGFSEVVATLGTALTPEHVRKVKGFTNEVVIVFDSDEAGKAAALKSLPILLNEGLSARAMVLPEGHDPDSFVNTKGVDEFLTLLDRASPMFDFYLEQKLPRADMEVEEKVRAVNDLLPVLWELGSETQRSLYVRRLSETAGIKESVLWSELARFRKGVSGRSGEGPLKPQLTTTRVDRRFDDLGILNLLIHHPRAIPRVMNSEWELLLSDSTVVVIIDALFQTYRENGSVAPQELMDLLESESASVLLRESLSQPSFFSDEEVGQAVEEIERTINQTKLSISLDNIRKNGKSDPEALEALNRVLKLKAQVSGLSDG
jgi:DNA primase